MAKANQKARKYANISKQRKDGTPIFPDRSIHPKKYPEHSARVTMGSMGYNPRLANLWRK